MSIENSQNQPRNPSRRVDLVAIQSGRHFTSHEALGGLRFHPSRREMRIHLGNGQTATYDYGKHKVYPLLEPRRR